MSTGRLLLTNLNDAAVVSFGNITDDLKSQAQDAGASIYSWEEFLNLVSLFLFWTPEFNTVLLLNM